MSQDSLINSHRPLKFSEVIGQEAVVSSFRKVLDDRTSHAFIFAGPAGTGKTTLARIGANYVETSKQNLIEVDAATYSRIEDIRSLTSTLDYRPLGTKGTTKSLIMDEAHAISRASWQALLKMVEEPPDWVYWFFCTTDISKVPETIRTRCSVYTLQPVSVTTLVEHLAKIVAVEKFDTDRSILDLCAKQAQGSPRRALSLLSVCYDAPDRRSAAELIARHEEEQGDNGIKLARALTVGKWEEARKILEDLVGAENENPESIRHVVSAYFAKIVIGQKDPEKACQALKVLDAFSQPFNQADGWAPLVVAVGQSIF